MAKELFNRNAGHKNIGEIRTENSIGGTTIGFWNHIANSIASNAKDNFANYKEIDGTPEKE